ncbi:MAG: twin-arginine translocase subunit TatC [Armatimonadota bacterium]
MSVTEHEESKVGYLSHFEELRKRLLIVLVELAAGIIVGWYLFPYVIRFIAGPLIDAYHTQSGSIITLHPGEAFFTQMNMSMVLGVVLASPFVLWQLWAFVRPGLTARERKAVGPLVPVIVLLFLGGALFAHFMMPGIVKFFIEFTQPGVTPMVSYQNAINFPLKIMLAFGVAFQLPIVLLGLVLLRILTPDILLKQWRVAVIIIGVLSALITPTPDAFTMGLMMLPQLILYFGTVLVAYWLMRPRKERGGDGDGGAA